MLFVSYFVWVKVIPNPVRLFIMDFYSVINVIFIKKENLLTVNKGIEIMEKNPKINKKLDESRFLVRVFKSIVKSRVKKYVEEEKENKS